MVDRFSIKDGMEVVGSDGARVGTVRDVETGRFILHDETGHARDRALMLSRVERVEGNRVHLTETASVVLGGFAERLAEATGDPDPHHPHSPRTAKTALYWALGLFLLLASLALAYCRTTDREEETITAPAQIEPGPVSPAAAGAPLPVQLPNGRQLQLAPDSLALQLRNYLATPDVQAGRSFQFERIHFDTGSAEVLAAEIPAIASVGQVLQAFPNARVRVVGFADARGSAPANADLGLQRAEAVAGLLAGNGVPRDRIETASGGEGAPAATNATAAGQAENRRTELVVTAL
ncbi:OmpA family protein [Sphingomonas lenta]|uniref:OmpA-like domain-containing protein n=1 Tax=Sphingomonas lenta TaxID=1141887 RepID=A0A2A2SCE5_9SPHN|nr:OmpA family protein [Sphingomonas lenta]PAX06865.1 hypothetical protein CKY28_12360 [Sphingomonas lenta]